MTSMHGTLPAIAPQTLCLPALQFLDGKPDREDRAAAVSPIGGHDRTALRLDEPPADGEAQAGAGSLPVAAADPIKLVEDALEILKRYAWTLVAHLDDDVCPVAAAADFDGRTQRGIFG